MEQRHNHLEALRLYREVQTLATTPEELHLAVLGQARCLMAMNNLPLAMAVLMPVNLSPSDPLDAERTATAGAVMLRMKRISPAENVLHAAVNAVSGDEHSPSVAAWLAPAYVDLAIARRENNNRAGTVEALQKAVFLFEKIGNRPGAERCRALEQALRRAMSATSGKLGNNGQGEP